MRLLLLLAAVALPSLARAEKPKPCVVSGGAFVLPGPILFEAGSDKIRRESDAALAHAKRCIAEKSYITLVRIETYGDSPRDRALTEKRALAVARRLAADGIFCRRLLPVAFVASGPKSGRTLIVAAAMNGRPLGSKPVDGGGTAAGDPCR